METVSGNGVGERFLNSEAEASVGNHRLRSRINRRLPKGNSVKVALAAGLRAETTMTVGWISRASDDGHMRLSEPSRVLPEEAGRGVGNIKN